MNSSDPREILYWTRTYARSRTIYFLFQWCLIVLIICVIGLIANLTQQAYINGNKPLFYTSVFFLVVAFLFFVWISISRWTAEIVWQLTIWFYGREGYVLPDDKHQSKTLPRWVIALIGLMLVYHIFGALLISFRYLSLQYLQPFSALALVPVLCILIFYQGLGFWAWIWPVLYGLHAILLICKIPISFPSRWYLLNIMVPVFGYGLIAIIVGHIYSRYALWKLKSISRQGLEEFENLAHDEETDNT
ncbi:MAG TPA: hypothetical protein PLT82_02075 [Candidatus Hydrogenedens sp.]|nr:hypothetical protein [Candidatus Hydrogenedens sp.]HOK08108.1 hypothetical protein [Candidatus Hydrogenedens sp.]HOL20476.1 hypothetical protein [Candidatus Hydrogenedens sp.]HPP57898.1 hypothetical protein [Candidatus Hydrogenedens sp.]